MAKSEIELVAEFHEKFDLLYQGPPRHLHDDMASFRGGFMIEELAEYFEAAGYPGVAGDLRQVHERLKRNTNWYPRIGEVSLVKQLDALVDLDYVLKGTAYLQGWGGWNDNATPRPKYDVAFKRVHDANMEKVRVAADLQGSSRKSKYDVVKPKDWLPPYLDDLVV
jgi:predicted HAD superfamily Cof-like phosphohydrolase